MDNKTLQQNEIEALSAIYGPDWVPINSENKTFVITLKDKEIITLEFHLPDDYPLSKPPNLTLSAPWMPKKDKIKLIDELNKIYAKSGGDIIIYSWIEKAKEYLNNISSTHSGNNEENVNKTNNEEKIQKQSRYHRSKCELKENSSEIFHGDPIVFKKSTFQAHCAAIKSIEQVDEIIRCLKNNHKIANATHNIYAYRIQRSNTNTFFQDYEDDGETNAGSRLLHLLELLNIVDMIVIVTRWFGGIKLGPSRFKLINNAASSALGKYGFIPDKSKKRSVGQNI